jgi:hypothetical protein
VNSQLIETLKALPADPARAIDLYPQLFRASLLVLIQEGSDDSLGSSLFLTYPSAGGIQESPVFTQQEYVIEDVLGDSVLIEFPGPPLWKRLLDIIKTGRCEAAVDPGQPHGIRLNREMVLGMVANLGGDGPAAYMAFQRPRRPSLRSGRSLRSFGSPLNALPLGGRIGNLGLRASVHETRLSASSRRRATATRKISLIVAVLLGSGCVQTQPSPRFESTTAALEQRDQPVTPDDLRLLKRADQLLANASTWDRTDDRTCSPDQRQFSLFCALHKASVEVLGEYQHRRVAMQEVRFAIEDVTGGREFEHRLMDFNNLEETTFADIKRVLFIARERVAARLAELSRP